ncbi:MAG: Rieske (2Fe-2S) protein [Kiloniellales bacterium]
MQVGTVLCRLDEIEDGAARGFTLETAEGPLDIFVVREGARAYGYVNACPHVGTPLDWQPHDFMSEDGSHIQCATHGALFRIEDGACIAGPCAGDRLQAVEIAVEAGRLVWRGPAAE